MNKRVKNVTHEVLSDNWYTLRKYRFDYQNAKGDWEHVQREAYDRGNGAAILLYNLSKKTIILTRQFRLPTYVNGNPEGFMIEACAGLLDDDNPLDCIRKETREETGYHITQVEKIFEAYMSPGAVTEILHFFIGTYNESLKKSAGGGVEDEHEDIEVLEMTMEEALSKIKSGEIKDAKTIVLIYHLRVVGLL